MEGESRKRQASEWECGAEEKLGGKKPRTPPANEVAGINGDLEREDMLAWLTLDEETVTELSKLLDPSEAASSSAFEQCNFKVKFIDNPYTSPVIFQSSSAYVTINGNEESCGSSFSESESSVMASVDRCRARSAVTECSGELSSGGAWGSGATEALGWAEGSGDAEGIIDGWDWLGTGFDIDVCDDDMWEKFLGKDLFGGAC